MAESDLEEGKKSVHHSCKAVASFNSDGDSPSSKKKEEENRNKEEKKTGWLTRKKLLSPPPPCMY